MDTHNTSWFLHVDLDAFFASVEQLDNPSYRGKPVIVGGKPEDKRSVVSTASYDARKFGVHSAMPTYQAYKLCPQGIYVHGRMKRYAELSYKIMNIFKDFSPDVQQMSIDEAFIDITGTEKLFGPPQETAMKIKQRVKQETGLTVSIGLATTQYLAKIASGYSKPDGFYFVEPGQETNFMLSLPLDKVWGVGKKTLELLRNKGFRTTRDIYDSDAELLDFLFGKNTAGFLYDAVRGGSKEDFRKEAKSHSISAETTFPDDITDSYAAETALLELAQGVFFRLLRENSFSRTAMVKIRYEDFSTVSIRETEDRNILTVDSFYEIIRRIFEKKYEKNRGIRLLGVGLENIETEEKPYQQDLFDTGIEKKQAVEKAILKLEKKHPEVKIQKARLLKSAALFFVLSSLSILKPHKILAEDFPPPLIVEAPVSLYEWTLDDKNNVDFSVKGYWAGEVSVLFQNNFGENISSGFSAPVTIFKQEVDLSSTFNLNNKWYFDAAFADEFKKNTVTFGYNGTNFLKSFKISNRNIFMQNTYSGDFFGFGIKGGENQSPGIALHFEDISDKKNWSGDSVIRYEMTSPKSAVFFGTNSVTDYKIPAKNFLYSHQFVIPEEASDTLLNIQSIYIEDSNGSISDENGKKYRKLSSTDYKIFKKDSLIIINQDITLKANSSLNHIPSILVTFIQDSDVKKIINSAGSYNDSSSFLGKIQHLFTCNGKNYYLPDFTCSLENKIEGKNALQLQASTGFSPFLCGNIYDCGLVLEGDSFVISSSSEQQQLQFYTTSANSYLNTEDFAAENHSFIYVYNQNIMNSNWQDAGNRLPFADSSPEIYLHLQDKSDYLVLYRNYNPVNNFDIGQKAVSSSVQVYVNNQLDYGAKYDSVSGYVSLSKTPLQTDKIYIMWQEESQDFSTGSIAAGAGINFNILPLLTGDFSITANWPVSITTKYATTDSLKKGFTAASTGIKFESEFITISDKTAIAITNENASGYLLVSPGANIFPKTHYLSISDGYASQNELYISQLNLNLLSSHNGTVKNHYGIKDSKISGYKIPLTWNFNNLSDYGWAAVDINLSDEINIKNTEELEIALFPDFSSEELQNLEYLDIYLQLGVSTENNSTDNNSKLPVWNLTDKTEKKVIIPLDLSKKVWQTVKIKLTDTDLAGLDSSDLRLIVYQKKIDEFTPSSGKLYVGPYEPVYKSLYTVQNENINVTSYSVSALASPSAEKLFLTDNSASRITWKIADYEKIISEIEKNDKTSIISAVEYFKSADFSNYNFINFDFSLNLEKPVTTTHDSSFNFELILDNHSGSIDSEGETALKLTFLNLIPYLTENTKWYSLQIDTNTCNVYINGTKVKPEDYSIIINKKIIPNRKKISFNTLCGNTLYATGNLSIDNLYYSETSAIFEAYNNIYAEVHKEGKIFSGAFSIDSTQKSVISQQNSPNILETDTTIKANADIAKIKIQADAKLHSDNFSDSPVLQSAGTSLTSDALLYEIISFGDTFRNEDVSSYYAKNDFIQFDFNKIKLPVFMKINTSANQRENHIEQNINGNLRFCVNTKTINISLDNNFSAAQKKYVSDIKPNLNFFESYLETSEFEFSAGNENSDLRNITINSKLETDIPHLKIKPGIEFKTETINSKVLSLERNSTDTTDINFSIPLNLQNNIFTLNLRKSYGLIQNASINKNYISDLNILFENQNNNLWFYSTIPFYDLFDRNLVKKINTAFDIKKSKEIIYTNYYEFEWKRTFSATIADFFIPLSANIGFSRTLDKTDSISDFYQIKTNIVNTSINNFGSLSKLKLFNWYEQDEFLSNISAVLKISPDNSEDFRLLINSYLQQTIYLTDEKSISVISSFSYGTDNNWSANSTTFYSRPGKNSILTIIPQIILKNSGTSNSIISRRDIINLSLEYSENLFHQKYGYTHSEDVKIKNNFTVGYGIGIELSHSETKAFILASTATLSGKMEF